MAWGEELVSARCSRVWAKYCLVVVIDDHIRLQMDPTKYSGIVHKGPSGNTAFTGYRIFQLAFAFQAGWFGYSDCAQGIGMDRRLKHGCNLLKEVVQRTRVCH